MTKEIALHCMKSASELERELCEDCPIYGQTGCDHCYEDALQYVIGMLEQEPTTKNDLGVDAISRADALALYCDKCGVYNCISKCSSYRAVEKMPPVTPQEPKTGHWICDRANVRCSCCGRGYKDFYGKARIASYNYCPDCGAKMESEDT